LSNGAKSIYLVLAAVLHVVLAGLTVLGVRAVTRVPGAPSAAPASPQPPAPPTAFLYVSPTGSDTNDGSLNAPIRTVQAGLDRATPGTQITLAPGVYSEELHTVRAGTPDAPIWIKGPESGTNRTGRYRAVLHGTGRVVSINHSYYVLDGFTVDGQAKLANVAFPTDLAAIDAFKDSVQPQVSDSRLIYVGADDSSHDLTGITIDDMFLSGAGGECVRMRNNAHDNAVISSVIQYCGMHGKGGGSKRATYHNGEGVYIGTSPKSTDQPMHDNDGSSFNVVARNVIKTFGSECFNVKENAHNNVFADNTCAANAEPAEFNGSNVELRGYLNTVRNNVISDSSGYSVKIASDGQRYNNRGNTVQNNRLTGSLVALKLDAAATQGLICGNIVETKTAVQAEAPPDITAPC
jgi:Right handed beta helix region/Protein of unknown function (DUF1565)